LDLFFPRPSDATAQTFENMIAAPQPHPRSDFVYSRMVYLYIMGNLVQDGRLEDAQAFHGLLHVQIRQMIGHIPQISGQRLTWARRQVQHVQKLLFASNPQQGL
jgi:hypothetical protein